MGAKINNGFFNRILFRKKLTQYLLDKGVTKTDLALEIGVTEETITQYEKGEEVPDVSMQIAIAGAFKINPVSFIKDLRTV